MALDVPLTFPNLETDWDMEDSSDSEWDMEDHDNSDDDADFMPEKASESNAEWEEVDYS